MEKYKVGDRVKVRHGTVQAAATIEHSTSNKMSDGLIHYSYSVKPDLRKLNIKWAWYPENDVIPIDQEFETPQSKTMWISVQELRNYYLLDCSKMWSEEALIYGSKNVKPTQPTLTGWIKYWRKTIKDHPEYHISYKSEQRKYDN